MGFPTKTSAQVYYNVNAKSGLITKTTKNDKGEYVEEGTNDSYSGKIIDVKENSYEYQGDTINNVDLYFTDGDVTEKVTFGINSMAKNLLNTLAGAETLYGRNVEFRMYDSKPDENGKVWKQIYVEIDGQKGEWKIPGADMNKMDDDAYRTKFITDNIMSKLNNTDFLTESPAKEVTATEEVSDLPFD